jgi:predicted nucleic acid-binding protein
MILVDSSAWIEFDRATGSPVHLRLRQALSGSDAVGTTGMVISEVLIGARDDAGAQRAASMFAGCNHLPAEDPGDYETAAQIYRHCRNGGETVRRMADCLIAAVAIRTRSSVLHRGADFDVIARHTALAITAV